MIILRERPPMFDEIDSKFNIRGKPILFSWGDRIYIPSGNPEVPAHLMAHERAHGARQLTFGGSGSIIAAARIELWWRRYLEDTHFRLEEEIIAHQAEYHALCRDRGGRLERRRNLAITAAKLAAPLYGRLISVKEAKKVLTDGYRESV
jgi:hypothetical protein